jgi:uncharacterized membrane protein HdeD (DUF308 family)
MFTSLSRHWGMLTLRGTLAIVFGIVAILWPHLTLQALVFLFGAYALLDGLSSFITLALRAERKPWWVVALEGVLGIIVGIAAFAWPLITALALLYLIALWAIANGAGKLFVALALRSASEDRWLLALSGAISLTFGALLVLFPGQGALALVWLIGLYAIIHGLTFLAFAYRLHRWQRHPTIKRYPDTPASTS